MSGSSLLHRRVQRREEIPDARKIREFSEAVGEENADVSLLAGINRCSEGRILEDGDGTSLTGGEDSEHKIGV